MPKKLKYLVKDFIVDESGLSAVEYGLLAAGIAVGLWAIISDMGTDLRSIFTKVQTNMHTAAT
jgi:pilus assembly protein Flp/PilA